MLLAGGSIPLGGGVLEVTTTAEMSLVDELIEIRRAGMDGGGVEKGLENLRLACLMIVDALPVMLEYMLVVIARPICDALIVSSSR